MTGDPALMEGAVRRLGTDREESLARFVRAMVAAGYAREECEAFVKLHWLCGLQVRTYLRIVLDRAANRDAQAKVARLIAMAMPDVGDVAAVSDEDIREYNELISEIPSHLTGDER